MKSKERFAQLTRRLARLLKKAPGPTLKAYLEVMRRFHRYSPANLVLIAIQRPDATLLKGYRGWQELGRQVRKGEKGIRIWAPIRRRETREDPLTGEEVEVETLAGFRLVTVFDIAQTEGKPLAIPDPLEIRAESPLSLEEALRRVEAAGIPVHLEASPDPGLGGWTDGQKIVLTRHPGRSNTALLKTLMHELAHYYLHFKDGKPVGEIDERRAEVEAELAAYLGMNLLGVETGEVSADYLKTYAAEPKELYEALARAGKAARKILKILKPAGQEALAA